MLAPITYIERPVWTITRGVSAVSLCALLVVVLLLTFLVIIPLTQTGPEVTPTPVEPDETGVLIVPVTKLNNNQATTTFQVNYPSPPQVVKAEIANAAQITTVEAQYPVLESFQVLNATEAEATVSVKGFPTTEASDVTLWSVGTENQIVATTVDAQGNLWVGYGTDEQYVRKASGGTLRSWSDFSVSQRVGPATLILGMDMTTNAQNEILLANFSLTGLKVWYGPASGLTLDFQATGLPTVPICGGHVRIWPNAQERVWLPYYNIDSQTWHVAESTDHGHTFTLVAVPLVGTILAEAEIDVVFTGDNEALYIARTVVGTEAVIGIAYWDGSTWKSQPSVASNNAANVVATAYEHVPYVVYVGSATAQIIRGSKDGASWTSPVSIGLFGQSPQSLALGHSNGLMVLCLFVRFAGYVTVCNQADGAAGDWTPITQFSTSFSGPVLQNNHAVLFDGYSNVLVLSPNYDAGMGSNGTDIIYNVLLTGVEVAWEVAESFL